MRKKSKLRIGQRSLIKLTIGFICLYLLFRLGKAFKNSLFFSQRDRINIVFYGEKPAFFSFGLADNVHYLGYFNNDFLVFVPGGYGRYRIGSLGKLANLEKKPKIIQSTFSSMISAYVDFYFYPQKAEVYSETASSEVGPLTVFKINYQTNANFFDRLYLLFLLINKRKGDFSLLRTDLNEEDFFSRYLGYFYQKFLRQERKNLQIDYRNYQNVQVLSRIIEGEGIRVVDLTPVEDAPPNCQIIDNILSKTSLFLAKIFDCKISKGDSGVGDIRLILGEKLEKEWE